MSTKGMVYVYAAIISICLASCLTRHRFAIGDEQRPYNRAEAMKAIDQLKEGLLLVSVPTDHRKIQLLQAVVSSESATDKKEKELANAQKQIKTTRNHYIQHFPLYYSFSDFLLLDDTLVKQYLNEESILLPDDLLLDGVTTVQRDSKQHLFLCRTTRDFDDLVITDTNGQQLPAPFPLGSQISTGDLDAMPFDSLKSAMDRSEIAHAAYVLSKKLTKFHKTIHQSVK